MRYRHLVTAFIAASSTISVLPATASAAEPDTNSGTTLSPIVVTATRTPRQEENVLAATTVITREEIEHLQPSSVTELLQWTPGVSISSYGGPGQSGSISIRGTNATHALVLINGVRYTSATSGSAAVQHIPVSQIKRIEIVRGPRASLYGADAVGGVIQIFTRNGAGIEEITQPYFTAGGGSNATYSGTIGISGNSSDSHFNITLGYKETEGFNTHSCSGTSCFTREPDDDGYERTSGSLRAGFELTEDIGLSVHALRIETESEFDGSTNQSTGVRRVMGAAISGHFFDFWHTELALGHERGDVQYYKDGALKSSFETSINTIHWQNTLATSSQHQVTAGIDYRNTQIETSKDYTQTERDTIGVFTQYLGTFGAHQVQIALRADDHEAFDDSVTGSINYGWHLNAGRTLTLSYGTAYNVPSFNDLYYPSLNFGDYSNPNLEPEQSESFEIGFKADRTWGNWAVYVYQTNFEDLIVLDSNYYPRNLAKARIRGAEASLDAAFGQWFVNASASYVDAENRTDGPFFGKTAPHKPHYKAKLRVTRQFNSFSLGASVKYGGERYEDAANTVQLDDFVLVGLRGTWQVTDKWQLQAHVDNLFDAEYVTYQHYNEAGRRFFVSVSYRP